MIYLSPFPTESVQRWCSGKGGRHPSLRPKKNPAELAGGHNTYVWCQEQGTCFVSSANPMSLPLCKRLPHSIPLENFTREKLSSFLSLTCNNTQVNSNVSREYNVISKARQDLKKALRSCPILKMDAEYSSKLLVYTCKYIWCHKPQIHKMYNPWGEK